MIFTMMCSVKTVKKYQFKEGSKRNMMNILAVGEISLFLHICQLEYFKPISAFL